MYAADIRLQSQDFESCLNKSLETCDYATKAEDRLLRSLSVRWWTPLEFLRAHNFPPLLR